MPGDGKQASFESRYCPRVLFRRRRFYSKWLLLGAFASEAARQRRLEVWLDHMVAQRIALTGMSIISA